jgi:hypothetical protein
VTTEASGTEPGVTKVVEGPLSIPVSTLALSVRTSNVLKTANILYLGDLVSWTEASLMGLQNCGRKSVAELRDVLAAHRLRFGSSETSTPANGEHTPLKNLGDYEEAMQARFFLRVADLRLSPRANNVLSGAHISYVGELVQKTAAQMIKLQSCGKSTVAEIESRLAAIGLSYGIEIADWDHKVARAAYDNPSLALEAAQAEAQRTVVPELQASCLEEELCGLVSIFMDGRNAEMIVKLFGWSGRGRRTLESVGQEYGITRERVRQIAAKTINMIRANKFELPWLTRAVNAARQVGPLTPKELAKLLRKARISRTDFDPSGIECACEELGIKFGLEVRTIGGQPVYGKGAALTKMHGLLKLCKRLTAARGCANFDAMCDELGVPEAERDGVRHMISRSGTNVWLDQDRRWLFSKVPNRNRLSNVVAKVLFVSPTIRLGELRRAVAKCRRLQSVPPMKVLAKFLETTGMAQRVGDEVVAQHPFAGAIEPGSVEDTMLHALKTNGPVLPWDRLQELCIAAGMNPVTVGIYMSISPIVTRVVRGVYAVVGSKIDPGVVEELAAETAKSRRPADSGWSSRGTLWCAIQLNRGTLTSGAVHLPSFTTSMIEGKEWETRVDGKLFGTVLKARNNFAWSLAKPLVRLGAEPGDLCILDFDLVRRTVEIIIGGEELVEAWESGAIDLMEDVPPDPTEIDLEEAEEDLSTE